MWKEFREFIMKGDVLNLAVGVVIGSAFTSIVNGVVEGLITPLIALVVSLFSDSDNLDGAFSALDWRVRNGVTFAFGDVISAVITFLITGFVLFTIVKSVNKIRDLSRKEEEQEVAVPAAEDYLREIRDLLEKNIQEEK